MAFEPLISSYKRLFGPKQSGFSPAVQDFINRGSVADKPKEASAGSNEVLIANVVHRTLTTNTDRVLKTKSVWNSELGTADSLFIGLALRKNKQPEEFSKLASFETENIEYFDRYGNLITKTLHQSSACDELMEAAQQRYCRRLEIDYYGVPKSIQDKLNQVYIDHPVDENDPYQYNVFYQNDAVKERIFQDYMLQEAETMQAVLLDSYNRDSKKDLVLMKYLNLLLILSIESLDRDPSRRIEDIKNPSRQKRAGDYSAYLPLGSVDPKQIDEGLDFNKKPIEKLKYLLEDRVYVDGWGSKSLEPLTYNLSPDGKKLFLDIVLRNFKEISDQFKQHLAWLDPELGEKFPGLTDQVNEKFNPSFEAFRAITAIYVLAESLGGEERKQIFELYRPFFAHPDSPVRRYFQDIETVGTLEDGKKVVQTKAAFEGRS